jgi:hypothetical protein
LAEGDAPPVEVPPPPPSPRKYWTRRGVAEWLVERAAEDAPTLVGIDHGFSFPLRYFELHGLMPDWPAFLDDFQHHWPTDEDIYVDFHRSLHVEIKDRFRGRAFLGQPPPARIAHARRTVAHRAVADGRNPPMPAFPGCASFASGAASRPISGRSMAGIFRPNAQRWVEVYPSLWSGKFVREERNGDQHDAYSAAAWMHRADLDGSLAAFLNPSLATLERAVAQVEGWILGVA